MIYKLGEFESLLVALVVMKWGNVLYMLPIKRPVGTVWSTLSSGIKVIRCFESTTRATPFGPGSCRGRVCPYSAYGIVPHRELAVRSDGVRNRGLRRAKMKNHMFNIFLLCEYEA